jgi:hypothetical protein
MASELSVSVKAVEKSITATFRKLARTDHGLIDRRVAAAVTHLRSQTCPFARRADDRICRRTAACT